MTRYSKKAAAARFPTLKKVMARINNAAEKKGAQLVHYKENLGTELINISTEMDFYTTYMPGPKYVEFTVKIFLP